MVVKTKQTIMSNMKEEGPKEIKQKVDKFQGGYCHLSESIEDMLDSVYMFLHRVETIEEFIKDRGIMMHPVNFCPDKTHKEYWEAMLGFKKIPCTYSFDTLAEWAEQHRTEKCNSEVYDENSYPDSQEATSNLKALCEQQASQIEMLKDEIRELRVSLHKSGGGGNYDVRSKVY